MILSAPQIIQKKRDEIPLSAEEIRSFVMGSIKGDIPDYQTSAFLMATFFSGMSLDETTTLTKAMVESGERLDLSHIKGPKVDKHSTGGVGDKVSLIIAPLAAACGLKVPMMAGRGLGHTGGTIDKLESIPGYRALLEKEEFIRIVNDVGCAIISQSEKVAPADRKFYALRDVTATIECVPLITSSILSKKIAEGAEGLVMDIKVGSGAFMKRKTEAVTLAKTLRAVAKKAGFELRSTISNMDQPLGYAVGNALEVYECIEIMKGEDLNPYGLASLDLKELTIHLCAQMLEIGKVVKNVAEGRKLAIAKLKDGTTWKKFKELVAAQGGDITTLEEPWRYMKADRVIEIKAKKRGYVTEMHSESIGRLLTVLGGGRNKVGEQLDHSTGFFFHRKLGSMVKPEDTLVTIFANSKTDLAQVEEELRNCIKISTAKKTAPKLIVEANVK
ncbi:MAG: thymidine phosphorylase [Bdellovibrionales bacterium]|nr:thymidine phosphorylase [Bdellovibrionales bacterium]